MVKMRNKVVIVVEMEWMGVCFCYKSTDCCFNLQGDERRTSA